MKKLMIAAAIVCAAAFAQASTVKWSSSDIFTPGTGGAFTETLVENNSVVGTLFMISESQWETYYNDGDYAKASAAIWKDYQAYKKGETSPLTGAITGKSVGGTVDLTDAKNYNTGTDVFAALIYETTVDGKDYYIANLGDYTAKNSAKTVYDFAYSEFGGGNSGTETQLTGWTAASAVPEPTSGLLLLLGVAGLALRRRRA